MSMALLPRFPFSSSRQSQRLFRLLCRQEPCECRMNSYLLATATLMRSTYQAFCALFCMFMPLRLKMRSLRLPRAHSTFQFGTSVLSWSVSQVTIKSLQIGGPFEDFASFSAAMIEFCVKLIENHQECVWLIDLVCPLRALSECLKNDSLRMEEWNLNDMKFVLNKTRSHFGKPTILPI